MKNRFTFLLVLFALTAFTFVSCDDENNNDSTGKGGKYFINYGNYTGGKSTVSAYDSKEDVVSNGYYKSVNSVDMISNTQYAYRFNNNIYFMGNNADEIFYVNEDSFEQTSNGISGDDINKPRHCVGQGDFLYVSCWGGDVWTDVSVSYILKINITTDKVVEKIALPGGPEGLAIANNKLFAALSYKDSVAVIELNNNAISYIVTPAVTSYFIKDKNDNLYVSLISTYSNFSTETGLGYINTTTNSLDAVHHLDGVQSTYDNIMVANTDFSKIYVMSSVYDENWNLNGAVAVFDVNANAFESDLLIDGISSINGIAIDGDHIFCLISETVTGNGAVKKYTTDGTFVKEYETGISPILFLDID